MTKPEVKCRRTITWGCERVPQCSTTFNRLRHSFIMQPKTPKTPTRNRAISETRTPLTPSLVAGLNAVSISATPHKESRPRSKSKNSKVPLDSNPFFYSQPKSRPASPVKRVGNIPITEELQRQASSGLIRRGGIESKMDVVTMDYIPPMPKAEIKRARSQPSMVIDTISTY
jgi:cell division cycle 20, cofactor of APC complex